MTRIPANYGSKLSGLLALLLVMGCQSEIVVFKEPPTKPEVIANNNNGFFYRLPQVSYALHVHAHRIQKQQGELQDFSHLLKMPMAGKTKKSAIIIDSIELRGKAYPDPGKQYFVSIKEDDNAVKDLLANLPTNPQPKARTFPFNMSQSAPRISLTSNQSTKQEKDKPATFERQVSFQQNISQLLKLNDELIGAVQGLSSDSTFQADSFLRQNVTEIRKALDEYRGRIQELKTLFNTFENREVGKRAQELSEILHKIVELKTALAGGQQDINYTNTPVAAMIRSLDSMIKTYQHPFQARYKSTNIQWTVHFKPTANQQQFQFGLKRKASSGRYAMVPYQSGKNYQARLNVRVKPENGQKTEDFHQSWQKTKNEERQVKGLFYNIPAPATLSVNLAYQEEQQLLGSRPVMVPQLGSVSHMPPGQPSIQTALDPFYGTLRSAP